MKETLRHARGGVRPRLGCLLLEYAATWRGCSHMERMQPHGEEHNIFFAFIMYTREEKFG